MKHKSQTLHTIALLKIKRPIYKCITGEKKTQKTFQQAKRNPKKNDDVKILLVTGNVDNFIAFIVISYEFGKNITTKWMSTLQGNSYFRK